MRAPGDQETHGSHARLAAQGVKAGPQRPPNSHDFDSAVVAQAPIGHPEAGPWRPDSLVAIPRRRMKGIRDDRKD